MTLILFGGKYKTGVVIICDIFLVFLSPFAYYVLRSVLSQYYARFSLRLKETSSSL